MWIPIFEGLVRAMSWVSALQQTLSSGASNALPSTPRPLRAEIPGGSPLSFCDVSRPTDLFNITMVQLSQQPGPIYIDDDFFFFLYGTFQDTFTPNATIFLTLDWASHPEEYGHKPSQSRAGATYAIDFCHMSNIMQPSGGKKKSENCPPEKGWALIQSIGYVWPMYIRAPGWYNFTFDARTAEGDRIYCLTTVVCLRWEDERKNRGYYPEGPWTNCTWPR
ncbi:hypothetical protein CONLIGDRAFT_715213 [Coniochaeta ligniaria NRRL 30616]|uniref:MD-2-related lipid-recognition domain-containing protein n=1 Tax=Coniochaeta ligniaria NRRL 30616 TaxID=1408157 RepID=A0A1J7IMN9_9PEZI|nr:hypothetical protein CONLIGDRAFT_715213 [Coniochaeta ligniaria NRRL 30616]